MNERIGFIKDILAGNYDVAGVFADWLEEHGEKQRGVLLRRRWKRWQKERAAGAEADRRVRDYVYRTLRKHFELEVLVRAHLENAHDVEFGGVRKADDSFRMYIRERFPQECYEASDPTNSQAYKDS